MNKKTQTWIASCALAGAVILTAATFHLAFVFPKTVAIWAEQGKQLCARDQFMVDVSNLTKGSGLSILGLLVLITLASLAWLAVSIAGARKATATQPVSEKLK